MSALRAGVFIFFLFGLCIPSYAADFKNSHDFLSWKRGQQNYFFQISVMMAATIAAQVKTELGNCIVDWYSNDPKTITKRHDEILQVMKKLPNYTPSAIVLAVLHKKCGKFTD